jgi:hypothetical protein
MPGPIFEALKSTGQWRLKPVVTKIVHQLLQPLPAHQKFQRAEATHTGGDQTAKIGGIINLVNMMLLGGLKEGNHDIQH